MRTNQALVSAFTPLDHLFHYPSFPPGMEIRAFKWWMDKGLYRIGHFYLYIGLVTMTHCINNLEMPHTEWFRFIQIAHFLSGLCSPSDPASLTSYEQWCNKDQGTRGAIFMTYASLLASQPKTPIHVGMGEGPRYRLGT